MSWGCYLFKCKEECVKGNVGLGLDLMVEDSYSGKWCDVVILFGGELFMVVLLFVFGLFDVV